MRRFVVTILIAAACTSAPVQGAGSPAEPTTPNELALYITDSFNGAGLMAVDPLTLQERSSKPLLAISPTAANNLSTVASPDGTAIAVMSYRYGRPPVAQDLDIAVFDAVTGALRTRFNPQMPVIVDSLSPDGTRIYARHWPPRDSTAERLVLDATNGKVLEREPALAVAGDTIAHTNDERTRRQYRLLVPTDPAATGPRAVDLAGWDLRTGKELWHLSLPSLPAGESLLAGEWKTGRIIDGIEVRSRLVPGLALSPDGRQIAVVRAFGCCGSKRTVWLIDASSGAVMSERTYGLENSFLDRLFAPSVAMAKSLDESVIVNASFSADGQLLYAYSHGSQVDDQGEAKHQYYGMVAVALQAAAVRGHDIKWETYWYENRIEWTRASPDGKWLYVFLERRGSANPKGYFLRRVDASTLRVLAERPFDGYRQHFLLASR